MENWAELARELERLLRFRTFPIAFKRLKHASEFKEIAKLRVLEQGATFCQLLTLSRTTGQTIGATSDYMALNCAAMLGIYPGEELTAENRATVWFESQEDGKKCYEAIPKIPWDGYEAVVIAPLAAEKFSPEVVMLYGTPAQMIMLINAIQWRDYARLQFFSVGESACADSLVQCYLTRKPSLTIPCYGERTFGHVQDDELVIAIPPQIVEKVVEGLRGLYARGIRYPIPFYGLQADLYGKTFYPKAKLWKEKE